MLVLIGVLLGLYVGEVFAGTCKEAYTCPHTCYKRVTYHTKCGLFNWGRCERQRTESYSCEGTCYRTVCCKGYTGNGCNTPVCFGSTSCPNGGTCQTPDKCTCPVGFSSPSCNDINECSGTTHGCQHNCVNSHSSYHCTCRSGYTLSSNLKTCLDVNECYKNNGNCGQICNNSVGSYMCVCKDGYNLDVDGRSCSDINECALRTSGCAHSCTNTVGSYTCSCDTGFELAIDGKKCEDIDECSLGSHECKDYCQNTPGSYTCSCSTGYKLDSDGQTCQDIDECSVSNGNCSQSCINQAGSYRCECRSGYRTLNNDGVTPNVCKDIDECTEKTSGCSQTCTNTDGSYTCNCNTGYVLDIDKKSCFDVDDCESEVCQNDGSCVDGVNLFTCICTVGFTGTYCQTDVNECEISNGGCQDICTNTVGSFRCNCSEGQELNIDGFSCTREEDLTVFNRLMIPRQLLPKACFTVKLVECPDGNNVDIFLTSTSHWYKLNSDSNIFYTLGIVFVRVNGFSLPVSLRGVEFVTRVEEFTLNYGIQYDSADGTAVENDLTPADCQAFELVESDIFDFISVDSFTKTLLLSLFPSLPDWLKFEKSSTEVLSVQDIRTDLVYGRNLDDVTWCDGAPVLPNHLYTVFRFDTGFSLRVLDNEVKFPKLFQSRKFCLIVDLCQNFGGTVFLMIPEGSRDLLQELDVFQTLKEEHNLHIRPSGIGISLVNGINAGYHTFSDKFWNGDLLFLPRLPQVDFWIGGKILKYDTHFTVEGDADLYLGIPSVQTMLTSMFREEWTGVIDIQMSFSPILRFQLFGKEYSVKLQLLTGTVDVYISIGGFNRQLCGDVSNPQGIFLSAMVEVNPFKGVPFLETFVFSVTNRLYAFITTDPKPNPLEGINIDISEDILELDYLLNNTMVILDEAIEKFGLSFSNTSTEILSEIEQTIDIIRTIIKENLLGILSGNLQNLIGYIEAIRQNYYRFRDAVDNFIDEIEFIVHEAKTKVIDVLKHQTYIIETNIKNIFKEVTHRTISSVGNYTGFGLKFSTDWKIFGLKFFSFDIEIVYSENDLFQCSRFDKIRKLLEGESALRILGRASREYKIGHFLKYEIGYGLGAAFALSSDKAVIQLQAFINMLGIKVTGDLFISSAGIYLYLEGNIWNIFLVQIDITAEVGNEWNELVFHLAGRFVAKARKRRSVQNNNPLLQDKNPEIYSNARERRQVQTVSSSFQDSYLDALKKVIRMISDEAKKRLSQAQAALSAAQNGLTKAQNWLDKKQIDIRKAQGAFDDAVNRLENAKDKLEAAKGPFRDAIKKLENAQRNVDNLCKIKTCSKICIPGLKCKICHKKIWFVKIPYPCCRLTSCMISFPNPLCVLANIACRIIRAAAYLVLEAAKIFVRVPMLAFDVAKAAVTVAQFVVDKSRVILTVAEGILELAKIGLEVAKGILESAKVALEAIKHVIGAAVKVLEFVIEYGLKSIIDVKNCGFNIELSTKDLPVFDVFCEVNPFRLGWTKINLRINFKNILQSLWQAAKATIRAIIDIFGGIFSGRKRRDIEFDASAQMHVLLRKIREADGLNKTDSYMNETIDISNDITGFQDAVDSHTDNRIQIFREKCNKITVIQNFMQFSFESLQAVVNESKSYTSEISNVKRQLKGFNNKDSGENITIENAGISIEYAEKDYNMTEDDLQKVIEETKAAAADDPLLDEIQSAAIVSEGMLDEEIKSVESVDYQTAWFTAMKNITREYFNASECEDFKDCIFYSISCMYDLYEFEAIPNITSIKESILDLENILIEVFQNESSSIQDTSVAMEYVLYRINALVKMNSFCSKPPEFLTQLKNQTVLYGNDVKFFCHVTGDPEPIIVWLLNDTVIENENVSVIIISNVTDENSYDKYNCIAGNVVANITSDDAYIAVFLEDEDECQTENGKCHHFCNNTVGSYFCSCFDGFEPQEQNKYLCKDANECEIDNGGCQHVCTNTEGSFTCSCNDGFILNSDSKTCTDIDECEMNNGECQHICTNEEGTFKCFCRIGFNLKTDNKSCIDINECLTSNGGCQHDCNNEEGAFTCSCRDGYEKDSNGKTCADIDECQTNNGGCQHICTNDKGTFKCSCRIGFNLQSDNKSCIDINECVTSNGGCQHNCVNKEGSYTCSCRDGFELDSDRKECVDIDECYSNNGGCQHNCTNEEGSYSCFCSDGFYLDSDRKACVDIDECDANNGRCQHICANQEGTYKCSCRVGFNLQTDNQSCIDINECVTSNGGCQQHCTNIEGSFTCSCSDGFELDSNRRTCIEVNECKMNSSGCQHLCKNEVGSFICLCYDGYKLKIDGKSCIDINECETNISACEHTCHNTDGSFYCSCLEGYKLENDGRFCTDINECEIRDGSCTHRCINMQGSYECSCRHGYELEKDGRNCKDIDECENGIGGCQQSCHNVEGSFQCSCSNGFKLHIDGKSCVDMNECEADSGGCKYRCINTDGSFRCSCEDGYKLKDDGKSCIDVNECELNDNGCEHDCVNQEGSYRCSCRDGFRIEHDGKSCTDINECNRENGGCDHICKNLKGSFECLCNDGYELHVNGKYCNDINECDRNKNGGCEQDCKNDEGSFTCVCYAGYKLLPDSISCQDIDECKIDNVNCEHECLDFVGAYACSCPLGSVLRSDNKTCTGLGKNHVSSSVRLNVDTATSISDPRVYIAISSMLRHYFETVTDGIQSVFINSLREGSIIANYTVVLNEDQNISTRADAIVKAILKLGAGATLLLDGKPVKTQAILPANSDDLCQLREMLAGPCQEGWQCMIDDSIPSCRLNPEGSASYAQIVAAVVGSVAFLLVLLVLILFCRYIRMIRNENRDSHWSARKQKQVIESEVICLDFKQLH